MFCTYLGEKVAIFKNCISFLLLDLFLARAVISVSFYQNLFPDKGRQMKICLNRIFFLPKIVRTSCNTTIILRFFCFFPKPQFNLNTIVRFDSKMTLQPPPPPTQTQCQQYLLCYLPDFDETLNIVSWEPLKQIPTVTVTFVQATFVLVTFVHIRNISAVSDQMLTKL